MVYCDLCFRECSKDCSVLPEALHKPLLKMQVGTVTAIRRYSLVCTSALGVANVPPLLPSLTAAIGQRSTPPMELATDSRDVATMWTQKGYDFPSLGSPFRNSRSDYNTSYAGVTCLVFLMLLSHRRRKALRSRGVVSSTRPPRSST